MGHKIDFKNYEKKHWFTQEHKLKKLNPEKAVGGNEAISNIETTT